MDIRGFHPTSNGQMEHLKWRHSGSASGKARRTPQIVG
jgi:hypothetical protein